MITYTYIVKCPECEDEFFDFFDDAKEFALGCISKNPIITQTEVCRNDFGECTDHHDLGTVWSWEDVIGEETDTESTNFVFTKDDLKLVAADKDPEFDNLDNSVDVLETDNVVEHINDRPAPIESTQKLDGIDNAVVDCEVAKVITHSEDEWPVVCMKPIPEGMTIEQLVEEMEENEDTVECTWCEELFDKSECRKEVNLGWLCSRCEAAIKSRGETLTFKENNYWDFLDEDIKKPIDEDLEWHTYKITFTDKVNPKVEHTTTFKTWQSDVEYAWRMSNANIPHTTIKNIELVEEVEELHDLGSTYDGGYPEEKPELPEIPEVLDPYLKLCPECGKETFDTETGVCISCGFN